MLFSFDSHNSEEVGISFMWTVWIWYFPFVAVLHFPGFYGGHLLFCYWQFWDAILDVGVASPSFPSLFPDQAFL